MDYIDNPETYKAVMFARDMIRNGSNASIAIRKAAYTYQADMAEVAKYVGQSGGRKKSEAPKKTRIKKISKSKEKIEFWIRVQSMKEDAGVRDFLEQFFEEYGEIEYCIYAETEKMVMRRKGHLPEQEEIEKLRLIAGDGNIAMKKKG